MIRERTRAELAINDMLGHSGISRASDQIEWAEDEIAQAEQRHPDDKGLLYHSFMLVQPTHELIEGEVLFRVHCRELLERVATGKDTRPATDAELLAACSSTSERAPLTTAATTLYMRVFARTFPEKVIADNVHYEHVGGGEADSIETMLRRKMRRPDRVIAEKPCDGKHHGEPAPQCPMARAS